LSGLSSPHRKNGVKIGPFLCLGVERVNICKVSDTLAGAWSLFLPENPSSVLSIFVPLGKMQGQEIAALSSEGN